MEKFRKKGTQIRKMNECGQVCTAGPGPQGKDSIMTKQDSKIEYYNNLAVASALLWNHTSCSQRLWSTAGARWQSDSKKECRGRQFFDT